MSAQMIAQRFQQLLDAHASWGKWALLLIVVLGVVLLVREQARAPSGIPSGQWFALDSRFINDHILIKVDVPGVGNTWWMLDTGSTHNLIDKRYARNATSRGRIRDVNRKDFTFESVDLPTARLAGEGRELGPLLELRNTGALDLKTLARAVTRTPWRREQLDGVEERLDAGDIVGVVGFPFLRQWVVSVDFPRQRVWIRAHSDAPMPPPGPSHHAPLHLRTELNKHKLLLVEMDVEGTRGPWSLDTGSNITVMSHEHPLAKGGESAGPKRSAQLVNRSVPVEPRYFKTQFVGSNGESAPQTTKIHVPEEAFAEAISGLDGNLGVNALKGHRLTFDYGNHDIVLD